MAITRAQQFRQMLIKGGIANPDGRRGFGGGATMGGSDKGYQGGGKGGYGDAGKGGGKGGEKNGGDGGGSPNIHGGPTYSPPTTNIVDEVALTGFGKVPGVDYGAVGPGSQFAKNKALQDQLLSSKFKGPNTPFASVNILGNLIGSFGYDKNTKFFADKGIGGKINPQTGKPYGYGIDGYKDYMRARGLGQVDAYGDPINQKDDDDNQQGIMTQYVPPVQSEPEPEEDDFEFYRRFRAEGGRAEYKQGSPKVDPRMKNTLSQNVAANNAQAAANAIQQAVNVATLTSPSSQMTTPQLPQPTSGTGPLFNPGFTVNTPTGPATFSSPGYYGGQGVMLDGKVYYSEKDAIDGLGIVRYNQLMADGGRAGFAEGGKPYEGGIMDLESARQMYGLGKLVKKVTRSVKKIAKSPIGKAALLYTGAAMAGSFGATGSLFSKGMFAPGAIKAGLFGQAMAPGFAGPGIPGLFTKLGLTKTAGSLMPTALGAIAGTSLIAGMLTPKQEEEAQRISDETGIDIEEIRANPDKYLARRFVAEGGIMRLGYADGSGDKPTFREFVKSAFLDSGQRPKDLEDLDIKRITLLSQAYTSKYGEPKAEGGVMGKEPVAKKTMPLLDMDGQEMDFRKEGGFVPLGRMEKADDVPARLSKNEFVFTADAVRNAGDGDVDKGAEVMYNMMKNLESGGDVSEESQGLEGARKMFQTSKRLEEVL